VTVANLTKWNGKAPRDPLQPKQKLVIWTKNKSASNSKTVRTVNYRVRSGDSLWAVSQKFNVTVQQVQDWNQLSDRTPLQPGQNLTLHVDVTQQSSP